MKIFLALIICFAISNNYYAQIFTTRNVPDKREFSESLVNELKVPAGFKVNLFAQGLKNPRMMAVDDNGVVYVTRPKEDDVVALIDDNGDGKADRQETVVTDLDNAHGITIHNGIIYIATIHELYSADLPSGGFKIEPKQLLKDFPEGGRHENRTLAFGPDEKLYISIGSTCNACEEESKESATILQANADGSGRKVFSKGLRNTIGFGWHPETKEMWGMDNGSDGLGDDLPPEELNKLEDGKDYGWPYCYGNKKIDDNMDDPEGQTKDNYCAGTEPAVLTYQAHSAPIDMKFYTASSFPDEYRNDAFVVFRGSWNRKDPTGYKVARLKFESGKPAGFEDFLTGFLSHGGASYIARPAGLAIMKDGSLLVSDDTNGAIYRVSYSGQ